MLASALPRLLTRGRVYRAPLRIASSPQPAKWPVRRLTTVSQPQSAAASGPSVWAKVLEVFQISLAGYALFMLGATAALIWSMDARIDRIDRGVRRLSPDLGYMDHGGEVGNLQKAVKRLEKKVDAMRRESGHRIAFDDFEE